MKWSKEVIGMSYTTQDFYQYSKLYHQQSEKMVYVYISLAIISTNRSQFLIFIPTSFKFMIYFFSRQKWLKLRYLSGIRRFESQFISV